MSIDESERTLSRPAIGLPGPDGWWLFPEGAAVHLVERTAVIADLHLGYEWARGSGGDCIPAHSLAETLARLTSLLEHVSVERLVVAGDLVESPRHCLRTAADVRSLISWLSHRSIEPILLPGNHDPRPAGRTPRSIEVAGWTIAHGDRPVSAARSITGHLHPTLRAEVVNAPCFLVGSDTIILPAFSLNAAGWNILTGFSGGTKLSGTLRCLAGTGDTLLDFGTVQSLTSRHAGSVSPGTSPFKS